MLETFLALILVFEIIRLVMYMRDSGNLGKANKRNEDFAKRMNEEWKLIRKAEIEELKQLARESDTMREIYDEWLESKGIKHEKR